MEEPSTSHRFPQPPDNGSNFACPYCDDGLMQESRFWNHIQSVHRDHLKAGLEQNDSLRFRSHLRSEAIHRAQSLAPTTSNPSAHSSGRKGLDSFSPHVMADEPTGIHRLTLDASDEILEPTQKLRSSRKKTSPDAQSFHNHPPYRQSKPRHSCKADVRPKPLSKRHYDMLDAAIASPSTDHPVEVIHVPLESSGTVPPNKSYRSTLSPSIGHFQNSGTSTPVSDTIQPVKPSRAQSVFDHQDDHYPELLLQPASREISQAQLAAEVKSIYAGLVMVENKCISVDKAQAIPLRDGDQTFLVDDHWQALIALHRTLLHEHHDFFLASQHPSASDALKRLALKYSMPARMWKHGIHSFLELLRKRLPLSLDYMLAFIYLSYQMVALLYETVSAFEETWIECLGDLGRYRMAIEDEDLRDRDTWSGTARFWYSKAADKNPAVGRLYHHLAILARPHALQQLYYYSRSLACIQPFPSARESILTLFDPILGRTRTAYSNASEVDTYLIKTHGIFFSKEGLDRSEQTMIDYLRHLDGHIGRMTAKWKDQGVYVAVINIVSLFDYGYDGSLLRTLYNSTFQREVLGANRPHGPADEEMGGAQTPPPDAIAEGIPLQQPSLFTQPTFAHALRLTFSTLKLTLQRIGDKNVLPHVHVLLVFLLGLSKVQTHYDCTLVFQHVPWEDLANFLNTLSSSENMTVGSTQFPHQADGDRRPLPEDYLIRGQIWSLRYFPDTWFDRAVDEDERHLELASTAHSRIERVMWLGMQLSNHNKWLRFEVDSNTWTTIQVSQSDYEMPDPMDIDITFDSTVSSNASSELSVSRTPPSTSTDLPDLLSTTSGAYPYLDNPSSNNRNVILPNYTRIICETGMLQNQIDVFLMLLGSGEWRVQIPVDVIFELYSRIKSSESDGLQAKQALESIRTALMQRRTVTIVGTKGDIVQDPIAFIEQLSSSDAMANEEDMDEVIINITHRASDLTLVEHGEAPTVSLAKPAVLVAENQKMRQKAREQGLTSVASSMIRKVLSQGRKPG